MKKSNMGFLLVMLVFAVFMVSILIVLLTGADVVQGITERDQKSYDQRTAVQYIATRVRQADQTGGISVRTTESGDRLVLTQEIEGTLFETMIYSYDGYLCELFCTSGYDPGAAFGEKILPAEQFCAKDYGEYLKLELTSLDGEKCSMILSVRSERGAAS